MFLMLLIFVKSLSHQALVLGGTQAHNLLIFGQTPEPFCLGVLQEASYLYAFMFTALSGNCVPFPISYCIFSVQ